MSHTATALDVGPAVESRPAVDPVLTFMGPTLGLHALIVGASGTALLCALVRAGCASACSVRTFCRVAERNNDIVCIAGMAGFAPPDELVRQARHVLAPTGRLVIGLDEDPAGERGRAFAQALLRGGFMNLRTRSLDHGGMLRADLPVFGRQFAAMSTRRCA